MPQLESNNWSKDREPNYISVMQSSIIKPDINSVLNKTYDMNDNGSDRISQDVALIYQKSSNSMFKKEKCLW